MKQTTKCAGVEGEEHWASTWPLWHRIFIALFFRFGTIYTYIQNLLSLRYEAHQLNTFPFTSKLFFSTDHSIPRSTVSNAALRSTATMMVISCLWMAHKQASTTLKSHNCIQTYRHSDTWAKVHYFPHIQGTDSAWLFYYLRYKRQIWNRSIVTKIPFQVPILY